MFVKENLQFLDLTHPLDAGVPTWNGSCGFCLEIKKDYDRMFRVQKIKMHAGVGTHMDAPAHRFRGRKSIADIPLEQLIAPICVIDVSVKTYADYELSPEEVLAHEDQYGPIPSGALVIVYTGWDRYWTDSATYRGLDTEGRMHFPAVSAKAAELLLKRDIAGLGIDVLSPDCAHPDFPVHELLLGQDKYIIENIANASQLPIRGAQAIALPLRAIDATEAPVRLIAFWASASIATATFCNPIDHQ